MSTSRLLSTMSQTKSPKPHFGVSVPIAVFLSTEASLYLLERIKYLVRSARSLSSSRSKQACTRVGPRGQDWTRPQSGIKRWHQGVASRGWCIKVWHQGSCVCPRRSLGHLPGTSGILRMVPKASCFVLHAMCQLHNRRHPPSGMQKDAARRGKHKVVASPALLVNRTSTR